ncbi:MAG: hypothetical protein HUJ31_12955 [Pseudomonadales bacterium]|nr:hypothetical protein [Pseudomonadales bacterium]
MRIVLLLSVLLSITARGQEPPGDRVYNTIISEYTIAIPEDHLIGSLPPSYTPAKTDEDKSSIIVFFSGAWLASHIDWYQPVLNNALQGISVLIYFGHNQEMRQNKAKKARALWKGEHPYVDSIVTDDKEPNTGLYIINRVPHENSSWFLVPAVPDRSKPYPTGYSWDFLFCSREHPPPVIKNAEPYTTCTPRTEVNEDIAIEFSVRSENLRIKDRITSQVAAEIAQWITRRPTDDD